MAKMMLATTANSTSIHFGMGHLCHKHDKLFTLEHIGECDTLSGCERIREFSNRLKEQPLLEWEKEERLSAIGAFALLTLQMKSLTE
jgi:hypothetical protein